MKRDVVVLSAVRSAIGTYRGALSTMEPAALARLVMQEAVRRSGVDAQKIEYVTVGNTLPTDARYAYVARVASLQAGLSQDSVAMAVNRLCASGLQAILTTAQHIALGDCDYGLGGGVEIMSRGGYMLPQLRTGARMGDFQALDMMVALLTDPFGGGHMGMTAENVAAKWQVSRAAQDALALESQRRAVAAIAAGRFAAQIVPVILPSKQGDKIFAVDEHVKPQTTLEGLSRLQPAFSKEGTVTAGNASGVNDGAAFLVLAEAKAAITAGCRPIARLVASALAGVDPQVMGTGPIPATRKALSRAGLTIGQMDVVEANEAFAAQAVAVAQALDFDPEKTNPNGGAIALGHPVGCTGAAITTKALHELERIQGKYALVTMCIGGGQGIAAIFERL